jgi:hypothetical protein
LLEQSHGVIRLGRGVWMETKAEDGFAIYLLLLRQCLEIM